jgi:hypothetical protein
MLEEEQPLGSACHDFGVDLFLERPSVTIWDESQVLDKHLTSVGWALRGVSQRFVAC